MEYFRQQRIYKVFLLFLLLFLFYLGRIYYIQVSNHQKYASKMLDQDTMDVSLEEYTRGNIYDRNMVPLTGAIIKNKVIVFPAIIKENKVTIKRLARILKLPDKQIASEIKISKPAHYLKNDLTKEQELAITKAKLPGIRVAPVAMRDAKPLLAVHTLGYLLDNVGATGLEKLYEKELRGTSREKVMRAYVDGNGQLISGLGYRVEKNVDVNRRNLVLTIDKRVQQVVENVMNGKVKRGAVVVMDSFSGDILAIAGRPLKDELNPTVQLYEPGSVFKIVVASAALEEGKVTPSINFLCLGNKEIIIKCSDPAGHGNITLSEAMAVSCNPTFVKVGKLLGAPKLIFYARRFGLENTKITGYQVEPESQQNLTLISEDIYNSSIGQGPVQTTPVQITGMSAIIANGGIYRQPRLVKELTNTRGQVTKSYPVAKGTRVISAKTAAQVNDMLIAVVTQGTGKKAAIAQGSAGKTGTAEAGKGGTYAWFTGYVPNNPKYVVTVFVNGGESGSKDAAPVFKEIMENIMKLP